MWLGLAVFAAAYALLAVPRLGRGLREVATARWGQAGAWALSRPGIALLGALLVVALLQVTPRAAWLAIDLSVLALLLGMMLLVAALDAAGAFTALAAALARGLPTPTRLLIGSMVAVAVLSALVLNDAVVLLFTPVLVRAARAMGVSPLPFLVGEAIAANLGSAATPTGNPQNAAIASARQLSFFDFSAPLIPVAVLAILIGIVVCVMAFRRELRTPLGEHATPLAASPPLNAPMLAVALGALVLAFAGFLVGPRFGVPLWMSALAGGLVALALSPAARASPLQIARRVDGGILAFFVGLFVLLEAVRGSGLLDSAADQLASAGSGGLVVTTALLSNLVSNVPAVLLILPTISTDAQARLLAAASTFAGNATFLGSAATVIVAEAARREGADFRVLTFTLVGLPIALLTLALAWLMLG